MRPFAFFLSFLLVVAADDSICDITDWLDPQWWKGGDLPLFLYLLACSETLATCQKQQNLTLPGSGPSGPDYPGFSAATCYWCDQAMNYVAQLDQTFCDSDQPPVNYVETVVSYCKQENGFRQVLCATSRWATRTVCAP